MSEPIHKRYQITKLLRAWQTGDKEAESELIRLVYTELKKIASAYLKRERENHTLQSTALVNEVYMRLLDQKAIEWKDRVHFFGIAARLMRQILIEHLRSKKAVKRGGGEQPIVIEEALNISDKKAMDLLKLDEALNDLKEIDPRKSKLVELRYFAGLSIEETAEVLSISAATVKREWRLAKAWLHRYMMGD